MAAKFKIFAILLMMGLLAIPAMGQAGGGGGGNGGGGGGGFGGGGGGNGGGGGGGGGRRGGGGGANGGGGGGGFNPQQMQQRQLQTIQTQLAATDDEFAALQPKIVAVLTAQQDVNVGTNAFGRGGAGGGRRGGGGGAAGGAPGAAAPGATPPSAVQQALTDLQTTLADTTATPDAIKTKLDAYRAAKAAAKDTLAKAQADLKSVLTQRQEAVLVTLGVLE